MSKISTTMGLFNLALIGLFVVSIAGLADGIRPGGGLTQLTGLLSLGMMAFALVLATRPRWMEPGIGGLDKMYRLHKWLGVGALVAAVAHWLVSGHHGHGAPRWAGGADTLFPALAGPARGLAEPLLIVLIVLVAMALARLIPYCVFRRCHVAMAALFVFFAFHSLVLMRPEYWPTPFGWATLALSVAGTAAAIDLIVRHFRGVTGAQARVVGTRYFPEVKSLEIDLEVGADWKGHRAGQFAFVTTDAKEGAHPFTLSTAWNPATRRVGFIVKELGDFTAGMRRAFRDGACVRIEGPYGRFTFDDGKPRQIWIGAGIGITPFVAKLRERAGKPAGPEVDLFHSTRAVSEDALARLSADAGAAGVRLHVVMSARDGRLDARAIMDAVPDWKAASVWFCGPADFGASLKRDLVAAGLSPSDFHQELFEMR